MAIDFTAVDFETANSSWASVCSFALVRVRGGEVVESIHSLVKPPGPVNSFSPFNIRVHGINAGMVHESPSWADLFPRIMKFIGGDLLVAHNANFDMSVLRRACAAEGIEPPDYESFCTLALSKRALELPSYSLPFVAEACGIELLHHHDAEHDARAAAMIAIALAKQWGCATLPELSSRLGVGIRSAGTIGARSGVWTTLARPPTNQAADPDHPLFGREVVFTGALSMMSRQDAWVALANVGGIPGKSVTKRTNVLVVGDLDSALLAPGQPLSSKARRVFDLRDRGQDIELMTENDFLRQL